MQIVAGRGVGRLGEHPLGLGQHRRDRARGERMRTQHDAQVLGRQRPDQAARGLDAHSPAFEPGDAHQRSEGKRRVHVVGGGRELDPAAIGQQPGCCGR